MLDSGLVRPLSTWLSSRSRWLSSTNTAPSVPTTSAMTELNPADSSGRFQLAPIVNAVPSSIVTTIQMQSGRPKAGFMMPFTDWA